MLSLEIRRNRTFLVVPTISLFSMNSWRDWYDHRVGLLQEFSKTSSTTQSVFVEAVSSHTLVLSHRRMCWRCWRGPQGVTSPSYPRWRVSFLPLHSHSNRRDTAVALPEVSGLMSFQYPKATMEMTTKRGLYLDTRSVWKITRPDFRSSKTPGNQVTRWRARDVKDLQLEKTLNFSEYAKS